MIPILDDRAHQIRAGSLRSPFVARLATRQAFPDVGGVASGPFLGDLRHLPHIGARIELRAARRLDFWWHLPVGQASSVRSRIPRRKQDSLENSTDFRGSFATGPASDGFAVATGGVAKVAVG